MLDTNKFPSRLVIHEPLIPIYIIITGCHEAMHDAYSKRTSNPANFKFQINVRKRHHELYDSLHIYLNLYYFTSVDIISSHIFFFLTCPHKGRGKGDSNL
jgi:hypothetical protein